MMLWRKPAPVPVIRQLGERLELHRLGCKNDKRVQSPTPSLRGITTKLCLEALSRLVCGARTDFMTFRHCYNLIKLKTLQGDPTRAGSEEPRPELMAVMGQFVGSSIDILKFESVLRT